VCRYLLLALAVALVLLMVVAAVVVQEYGWPGFLLFLVALAVLAYVARRTFPQLLAYMLTRPLRQMGAGLRGARLVVHSVVPCDPPPSEEWDVDEEMSDDDRPRIADRDRVEEPDADDGIGDDEDDSGPTGPLDWYRIEFTVVPPDGGSSEGRMVQRRGWAPPMITAVGPRPNLGTANPFRGWPPANQFPGNVQHTDIEIWTGSAYEPPPDEAFGEQRLRLRIGVTRDVRTVTITYVHFTDLGEVRLPRIDVSPGPSS
jgi:hypothetical protein